jgi:hypothetical protein
VVAGHDVVGIVCFTDHRAPELKERTAPRAVLVSAFRSMNSICGSAGLDPVA